MQQQPLDSAALDALPIFPLPDVVLFPGALLPLHVFEPRYRELTGDVLAGARLMAVVRLRAGYEAEYQGRPPIHEVAGVGFVVDSERRPDGRYDIMLRGVARVAIREEHPPTKAYRVVRSRLLLDVRPSDPTRLAEAQRSVIALCDRLSFTMGDAERGASLRELCRSLPSPGACADLLAATMIADPDERQALLETLDAAERLDRVAGHVASLLVRVSPSSGTPN